jgi:hypothetical protein
VNSLRLSYRNLQASQRRLRAGSRKLPWPVNISASGQAEDNAEGFSRTGEARRFFQRVIFPSFVFNTALVALMVNIAASAI